jgi:hypothetical protein
MPVWFVLDGEELVFATWGDSIKAGTSAETRARRWSSTKKSPHTLSDRRQHRATRARQVGNQIRWSTVPSGEQVSRGWTP